MVGRKTAATRKSTQSQVLKDVFPPSARRSTCPTAEPLIKTTKAAKEFFADEGYDSAELRKALKMHGSKTVIPNKANRKKRFRFSKKTNPKRNTIEDTFCRLKDFRRIAARYNRLTAKFAASIYRVAAVVWRIL